jgi:hypothetical protein
MEVSRPAKAGVMPGGVWSPPGFRWEQPASSPLRDDDGIDYLAGG